MIAVLGWNALNPTFLPFFFLILNLLYPQLYLQYLKRHNPCPKQLSGKQDMSSQPRVPAVWKDNTESEFSLQGEFHRAVWQEDGVYIPTSPACRFLHLIPCIPTMLHTLSQPWVWRKGRTNHTNMQSPWPVSMERDLQ